jgi:hypothetical protein
MGWGKETDMKTIILGLAALGILAGAPAAFAQDNTVVIEKEHHHGDRSKVEIKRPDGSKVEIKRHGDKEKQVYTNPAGQKTVIKKKGDIDEDR